MGIKNCLIFVIYFCVTFVSTSQAMELNIVKDQTPEIIKTIYIPREIVINSVIPNLFLNELLNLKQVSQYWNKLIQLENFTIPFNYLKNIKEETKTLIFFAQKDNLPIFYQILRRSSFLFHHIDTSSCCNAVCSSPDAPADMIESLSNPDETIILTHTTDKTETITLTNKDIANLSPFIKNVYCGNFNQNFFDNTDHQDEIIQSIQDQTKRSPIITILFKSYPKNIKNCLYLQTRHFTSPEFHAPFFLACGADVNTTISTDTKAPCMLYYAIQKSNTYLFNCLLRNKADLKITNKYNETPFTYACHQRSICNNFHERVFIENKLDAMINQLLNNKIDIHHQNSAGYSGLHHLVCCYHTDNITEIIHLLLKNKINPNLKDKNGNTALHCAAQTENLIPIQLLLKHSGCSSLDEKNNDGNTPLITVLQNPFVIECQKLQENPISLSLKNIIQCFLSHKANVCITNNNGESVLSLAMTNQHIKKLIDINHQDTQERTIMHNVIEQCNYALALKLIETYSPDLTRVDNKKNTLLHTLFFVCKNNDDKDQPELLDDIKKLIEQLAFLADIKNNDGETPIDIATRLEHRQCIDYLQLHFLLLHERNKQEILQLKNKQSALQEEYTQKSQRRNEQDRINNQYEQLQQTIPEQIIFIDELELEKQSIIQQTQELQKENAVLDANITTQSSTIEHLKKQDVEQKATITKLQKNADPTERKKKIKELNEKIKALDDEKQQLEQTLKTEQEITKNLRTDLQKKSKDLLNICKQQDDLSSLKTQNNICVLKKPLFIMGTMALFASIFMYLQNINNWAIC